MEKEGGDSRTTTTMVGEKQGKKNLEDFTFYVDSTKQASNYENTALFMINHTKKDLNRGKDITKALQKLEYKNTDNWNPILKVDKSSDDNAKGRGDRHFKL